MNLWVAIFWLNSVISLRNFDSYISTALSSANRTTDNYTMQSVVPLKGTVHNLRFDQTSFGHKKQFLIDGGVFKRILSFLSVHRMIIPSLPTTVSDH